MHILSGSEGTLAAMVAAELTLFPCRRMRRRTHFLSAVADAMQATEALLELHAGGN